MKSRLALVSVLALGVFMSGTGATLAVSGLSSSGSASYTQYQPEEEEKEKHICTNGNGGNSGSGSVNCDEPESCATTGTTPSGELCETQVFRQEESSSGGSLPFTGFMAIPVLIVGIGLLGAGVAMRVRMRSGDHPA